MPDGSEPRTVRVLRSVAEVPAAAWDACAGGDDPFVGHAFLAGLEESGSVAADAGWMPQHLAVVDDAGDVLGCAPLYLKGHSYGEYVFDWGWADAYERAGGRYYPKLQAAVPFTPVTGRRLLLRPDSPDDVTDALIAAMLELARRHDVSSLHVTFPTEGEWRRFAARGFLRRIGQQYHWQNEGYDSFDDFLGALASRKRKAIRKERAAVSDAGVTIRALSGGDLEVRHWDAFYRFYLSTSDRKWGHPYLNREFFARLHETMADRVVLVMAEADGRPVAGALNLRGANVLYGRYWGCVERYRFLHFEACYYQAIEYAIEHGLGRVEAGAQGPHKIHRGYLPVRTYSAHWIADAGFRDAIERYLSGERPMVEAEIAALCEESPFRKEP